MCSVVFPEQKGPRTSRQEAEELSHVIEQTSEVVDNYKEKQLRRQVKWWTIKQVFQKRGDDVIDFVSLWWIQ